MFQSTCDALDDPLPSDIYSLDLRSMNISSRTSSQSSVLCSYDVPTDDVHLLLYPVLRKPVSVRVRVGFAISV